MSDGSLNLVVDGQGSSIWSKENALRISTAHSAELPPVWWTAG